MTDCNLENYMPEYFEVRWHGRGGQGTVTGAKSLAEAVHGSGKYVSAFPDYGPERRGAPLRAFNRFSDDKIQIHVPILEPDVVMIVDPTLIGSSAHTTGMAKKPFSRPQKKWLSHLKTTAAIDSCCRPPWPVSPLSVSLFTPTARCYAG